MRSFVRIIALVALLCCVGIAGALAQAESKEQPYAHPLQNVQTIEGKSAAAELKN